MKYLIQELRNNKKFIEYSTNIKNKISPIELLQNHSGDADT